jgi:2-polyprenyl-3-methyl-5-hydroxy-6-metoxy-1,4-benzoquinol methylase
VPSSDRFGRTMGAVNRCLDCGHGCLAELPELEVFEGAYADATDPVSIQEEQGQLATAGRDLERIERWVSPGRLLDVGCWTGSFLVAARRRGWQPEGLEPSKWAVQQATERGCDVRHATLEAVELPPETYSAIVATDVIEHLVDPGDALIKLRTALEPGGVLFLAVPDAGSGLARVLGRRWWSVLPMHVQYFTRRSMRTLLERCGLDVVDVSTHPKAFSFDYYADRLATYAAVSRPLVRAVTRSRRLSGTLVAPDLRDRMAVVARRTA